jgi:ectoine hydroxylase-related dioxygenase (phytanoyl-CoA dioxygenase family)
MQNKNKTFVKKFLKDGYVVINALNQSDFNELKKSVVDRINTKIKKKIFTNKNINIYHKLISGDEEHKQVIFNERYVKLNQKIIKNIKNNKIINSIVKNYWGHNKFVLKWIGSSLKKSQIKNNFCGFRISRPIKNKKYDTAGPHCDIHVGGRISFDKKIMITAWIPLEGFSKIYTLQIYKGSHNQFHPLNKIKKRKNTVSRIFSNTYLKKFKKNRINLKPGKAIIIHPNLIHGGGENLGKKTRLSVEVRIYNIKNIIKYPISLRG